MKNRESLSVLALGLGLVVWAMPVSSQTRMAPESPTIMRGTAPEGGPQSSLDIRVDPSPLASGGSFHSTQSPVYVPIPEGTVSFTADEDNTNVAIMFSAEAATSILGSRMFVRALVDGVLADPADVVFNEGLAPGARSFTFTTRVNAGIHTVEMQWMRDPTGPPAAYAYIGATSVKVRTGLSSSTSGVLRCATRRAERTS